MSLKLDKKLNLILPLDYGEVTVYVHVTPIDKAVFENHYLVISKTFAKINGEGLSATTGPRVAYLVLRDVAKQMGVWEGPAGVANTLVPEIVRRANTLVPTEKGWQLIPYQEALDTKLLDEDDAAEVLNALVFFTVGSAMYPKRSLMDILTYTSSLWGGRLEPLTCTELAASLPTSTAIVNTGVKTRAGSSVPS